MAGKQVTGKLLVEADGGSRGNPGPAGYGAVVRDADSGEVLAELSESLGTTTNNIAEYSGLVAGLEKAADLAPGADVDVRMDSKLVVEQMSGRWQIKHPALQPLASRASQAARRLGRVRYEWVPRARNAHADRLANQAMDGAKNGGARAGGSSPEARGPDSPPRAGPRMVGGAGRAHHHRAAPARRDPAVGRAPVRRARGHPAYRDRQAPG